jgi:hypothetical protein
MGIELKVQDKLRKISIKNLSDHSDLYNYLLTSLLIGGIQTGKISKPDQFNGFVKHNT